MVWGLGLRPRERDDTENQEHPAPPILILNPEETKGQRVSFLLGVVIHARPGAIICQSRIAVIGIVFFLWH